jgi:hypothetical protein
LGSDRYLRPDALVLGEGSVVPPENEIRPPPNRFTHRLNGAEPFSFRSDAQAPDGELEAGTQVVLLRYDGGARCRVADGRGLYVEVRYESLVPLSAR